MHMPRNESVPAEGKGKQLFLTCPLGLFRDLTVLSLSTCIAGVWWLSFAVAFAVRDGCIQY